ncbi:MAG: hypothetical protein BZY80_03295 [SAR202 cluster bacterium Io17-Chloro-G2]|nr:MAG: hypothetical protein BZY80_03295 [SAR202 cluster bacterium Io17-Chloro-G2]
MLPAAFRWVSRVQPAIGPEQGGYFEITPSAVKSVERRYIPGTNVLETTFQTETEIATLTVFMPLHHHPGPTAPLEAGAGQRVARILDCTQGSVDFSMSCYPRFDYGAIIPNAVVSGPHNGFAHGGAEELSIYSSLPITVAGDGFQLTGELTAGRRFHASVSNQNSFPHQGEEVDAGLLDEELAQTVAAWREWSEICTYTGPYRDDVLRSALVLMALTYAPSGDLVAAATTSLPETIGGSRNWDYRFTWLRDAASPYMPFPLSVTPKKPMPTNSGWSGARREGRETCRSCTDWLVSGA